MKVLDLRCAHGHGFEGWFGSEGDYGRQREAGLVTCPACGDGAIEKLPSAPRLNFGAAAPAGVSAPPAPAARSAPSSLPATSEASGTAQERVAAATPEARALQELWTAAVKHVMAHTEDVGTRFPEEARRIHYGETAARGIRGQASPEQRAELADEGIEVVSFAVPETLKGSTH